MDKTHTLTWVPRSKVLGPKTLLAHTLYLFYFFLLYLSFPSRIHSLEEVFIVRNLHIFLELLRQFEREQPMEKGCVKILEPTMTLLETNWAKWVNLNTCYIVLNRLQIDRVVEPHQSWPHHGPNDRPSLNIIVPDPVSPFQQSRHILFVVNCTSGFFGPSGRGTPFPPKIGSCSTGWWHWYWGRHHRTPRSPTSGCTCSRSSPRGRRP